MSSTLSNIIASLKTLALSPTSIHALQTSTLLFQTLWHIGRFISTSDLVRLHQR